MATPPPREHLVQNRLLRTLSSAERQPLLPALELVPLHLREHLIEPDVPFPFVYFPLHGVVSLISTLGDGTQVEVATIGNEGLIGLPLVLYANTIPFTAFVQVSGEVHAGLLGVPCRAGCPAMSGNLGADVVSPHHQSM